MTFQKFLKKLPQKQVNCSYCGGKVRNPSEKQSDQPLCYKCKKRGVEAVCGEESQ